MSSANVIQELSALLNRGLTLTEASKQMGIKYNTLYHIILRNGYRIRYKSYLEPNTPSGREG